MARILERIREECLQERDNAAKVRNSILTCTRAAAHLHIGRVVEPPRPPIVPIVAIATTMPIVVAVLVATISVRRVVARPI